MKQALPVALAALVVSLVALALSMTGSPPPPAESAPTPTADPAVAARVADLASENVALERRIADLELALAGLPDAAPERSVVGGPVLDDAQLEEVVEEVRRSLGAGAAPLAGGEAFTEKVAESLDKIRTTENRDKLTTGVERRRERLAKAMPRAIEALGLTSDQELGLQDLLTGHYEAQAEVQLVWTETGDAAAAGELKATSWTTLQEGLETLLTPEQLETYEGLDGKTFPGASGGGK